MDHEAYENQMIEAVNRNAEDKTGTHESAVPTKRLLFTKTDARTLKRGIKRTVLALLTAILFALSVYSFIAVASVTGYRAVGLFFVAIMMLIMAFILLYAQGITFMESRGDHK
jgi:hypothetical protein